MNTIATEEKDRTAPAWGPAASWLYAVGYGIVCGLVFPLMVSSVFLQEMTLSHGAGNSFGLLFFIAYGLTMAGWTIASRLKKPGTTGFDWLMALGLLSAFVGNAIMFARQVGAPLGGWGYAVAAAGTIGFGLATAELAWLNKFSVLETQDSRRITRLISLSYLVGCAASLFIFEADGPFELTFALGAIIGCAIIGTKVRCPLPESPVASAAASVPDLFKAVLYLAVFSFVFGAISQASAAPGAASVPVENLALLGIALAGAAMFGSSFVRRGPSRADDMYWLLFPVVALSLVALPFIESPLMHTVATVLVFAAYYLTGINIRTTVCRVGAAAGGSAIPSASLALAVGTLCILGGVAVGAMTLANGAAAGLAFISLISLFVLSLHPVLGRFIDRRQEQDRIGEHPAEAPRIAPLTLEEKTQAFARAHDMTSREAEVLLLICQGRTRTYIASELGISPNTVKGYMHSLYQKAGVTNKQELIDLVSDFSG